MAADPVLTTREPRPSIDRLASSARARRKERNRAIREARVVAWSFHPRFARWSVLDWMNPSGAKGPHPPAGPQTERFAKSCEREVERIVRPLLPKGWRLAPSTRLDDADLTIDVSLTAHGVGRVYGRQGEEAGWIVSGARVDGTVTFLPAPVVEGDRSVELPALQRSFRGTVEPPQSYVVHGPRRTVHDPPFVDAIGRSNLERKVRRLLSRAGVR